MPSRRGRRTPLSLVLALSLAGVLTACGGSGDDTAAPVPSVASSVAAPSPEPSAAASPAAAAEPSPEASAEPSGAAPGDYVDPSGFAITYPDGWEVQKDVAGLTVVGFAPASEQSDADFRNNIGVVSEDTKVPSLTIERYLQASVKNAPKFIQGFQVVDQDPGTGTLEYTGKTAATGERTLHFLARVVIEDGKAHVATYTSPDETFSQGRPSAEQVLSSLRTT